MSHKRWICSVKVIEDMTVSSTYARVERQPVASSSKGYFSGSWRDPLQEGSSPRQVLAEHTLEFGLWNSYSRIDGAFSVSEEEFSPFEPVYGSPDICALESGSDSITGFLGRVRRDQEGLAS